jgi:hypothetical protein
MGWDGVSELRPATGILFIPQDDITYYMSTESRDGIILAKENPRTRKKPAPVPLCSPQIPHGLTLAWNRAFAVRGGALATARPNHIIQEYSSVTDFDVIIFGETYGKYPIIQYEGVTAVTASQRLKQAPCFVLSTFAARRSLKENNFCLFLNIYRIEHDQRFLTWIQRGLRFILT